MRIRLSNNLTIENINYTKYNYYKNNKNKNI